MLHDSTIVTMEVQGVKIDVHYLIDIEHDQQLSNSPINYYVVIHKVCPLGTIQNIKELLSQASLAKITDEIITITAYEL